MYTKFRTLLLVIAISSAFIFGIPPVRSEEIVDNQGVHIYSGGWKLENHTDKTYKAFLSFKKRPLEKYDYYYQLRIVPQYDLTFSNCTKNSMFKALVGSSGGRVTIVKATIDYSTSQDKNLEIFKEAPLIQVGKGVDPDTRSAGNGCFFQAFDEVSPLFRFNGGGAAQDYDQFKVDFTILHSESLKLAAVATLSNLFGLFNAAFSWTDISGERTKAYQAAAEQFQTALNAAGTFKTLYTRAAILKSVGGDSSRLIIAVPNMVVGYVVMYTRLYGSIGLDTLEDEVTPESILKSDALSWRCPNQDLATRSACSNAGNSTGTTDTLRVRFRSFLGNPSAIFDLATVEGRRATYAACSRLRDFAEDTLRLSTLDSMLVRWAFTKKYGVQQALKDPERLKQIASDSGASADMLISECWNEGDEETLQGVAVKLNKKLK